MRSFEWKQGLLVLLALAGTTFLGYRVWMGRPSDHFLKPVTAVPAFSFTDENGKIFSSAVLKDKVWVADFIFTRCAGECPMLSVRFQDLQERWKNNLELRLVSFSVDPERDTVAAFKTYADNLHADESQWIFLTGKKADLYKFIREGLKLTAQEDPKGDPGFEFIHSTRLILVDGNGMIRGLYDGQEDEDFKKLQKDIAYLLKTKRKR